MPSLIKELSIILKNHVCINLFYFKHGSDKNIVAQLSNQEASHDLTPNFDTSSVHSQFSDINFSHIKSCKLRIKITGDLAFYAACIGKVNMSDK